MSDYFEQFNKLELKWKLLAVAVILIFIGSVGMYLVYIGIFILAYLLIDYYLKRQKSLNKNRKD